MRNWRDYRRAIVPKDERVDQGESQNQRGGDEGKHGDMDMDEDEDEYSDDDDGDDDYDDYPECWPKKVYHGENFFEYMFDAGENTIRKCWLCTQWHSDV